MKKHPVRSNFVITRIQSLILQSSAIFILLLSMASLAQPIRISGMVRDANSYREIDGVNILIVGTQLGTVCNAAGRYTLQIPPELANGKVKFQHVSYYPREISIDSLSRRPDVRLRPRVITMPAVDVVGQGEKPSFEIVSDLPQSITLMDAKNFELRGFADAGDYLRTDAGIQVDEEMSGKKTISMRGGNSDDIVVLYNGVKLNSLVDNTFDFSLIDLDHLQRFEVIRGGTTALYGPEAFSGVINIVPQSAEKYTFQAQYRMGTFNTNNYTLNLNKTYRRINVSYGYKTGETTRYYAGASSEDNLQNQSAHHTFDLQYHFPQSSGSNSPNALNLTLLRSNLEYNNHRDNETLKNGQDLVALKYNGDIAGLQNFNLMTSLRNYSEDQGLHYSSSLLDRSAHDQSLTLHIEKGFNLKNMEWVAGYQFNQAKLDLVDDRQENDKPVKLQDADFTRQHHGLVAVGKIKGPTGSSFLRTFEVDFSARRDDARDEQNSRSDLYIDGKNGTTIQTSHVKDRTNWQATSLKLAASLNGYTSSSSFQSYISYGTNNKFPTLLQMMNSPLLLQLEGKPLPLKMEKIRILELGVEVRHEIKDNILSGWRTSANYFQNYYDNKFRAYTTPGIPITFYDNVPAARVSGIEGKYGVFFLQNKVLTELSFAELSISEKAAFPFKSDFKMTLHFSVDHAGFFFNVLGFYESDQIGWMRMQNGEFVEVLLPSQTNLDLHFGKIISIHRVKLFINFSGRNLLNTEEVLMQGLSLRDRRFYLSLGLQI